MFIKKLIFFNISFLFLLNFTLAQKAKDLNSGFITGFSYGYNTPKGDIEKRFGDNFKIDLTPTYYFSNSNISIGIEASYIFGSNVKENSLTNLISYDNHIVTNDYGFAAVHFSERGAMLGLLISKIVPFNKKNTRSGIRLEMGGYAIRHWIKFRAEGGFIPQIENGYLKGYDRLTGGIALKEFIGYQYLKDGSNISFYTGFEFIQGFTKNLREYSYNSAQYDLVKKKDYLFGFKFGWILPLYIESNPEEIFY
jgi:hypothetical protein